MGNRYFLVILAACGPLACQPGKRPAGGTTLDDHDHLTVVATVDAMRGRTDTGVAARHLRLMSGAAATAEDSARADVLVLAMRDGLGRYRDIAAAEADGFEDLVVADSGAVTHLVNWKWAVAEAFRFNPAKPAALVYRTKRDGDRVLLGAMYTAPDGASLETLDRRVPVRVARWHQHIDWCTPKRGDDARWTETARDGAPVFGPASRIATQSSCDSVAGAFHPHVFGWMVHANVFASDEPGVIWGEPGDVRDSVVAAPVTASPPAPVIAPKPTPKPKPAVLDTALPPARHPAVVLVHATSAAGDSLGDQMRTAAEALDKLGYVTEVVNVPDAPLQFPASNHAVGDAITQLAGAPRVDTTRIALLGVAFGGRLAVLHAAGDRRVKCVVDYFGGVGEPGMRRITRMPPVDIIGFEGDAGVVTLHDGLTRLNVPTELHLYPGRSGKLAPSDRRDAGQGVTTFLGSCLSGGGTPPAGSRP
jgi:Dienelactone hydrolase family